MHSTANCTITPLDKEALFYWSIVQNLERPARMLLADHEGSLPGRFARESGLAVVSLDTRCECVPIDRSVAKCTSANSSSQTEQLTKFDFYLGRNEEVVVSQRNILAGFCHETARPFAHKQVTVDSHFNALKNLKWIHLHDPYYLDGILVGATAVLTQDTPIITFKMTEPTPLNPDSYLSVQCFLNDIGYMLYDINFAPVSSARHTPGNEQTHYLALKDPGDHRDFIHGCRASIIPYTASPD